MIVRLALALVLAALIVGPLALQPATPPPPADARRVAILTPHNEQIRREFELAFDRWHRREHGEPAQVVWMVPGGTSEIRRMLESQYAHALERGASPGGVADLVFGGGSYEHGALKRGVRVNGRDEPISAPLVLEPDLLDAVYPERAIAGTPLLDADGYWHGTALSGFGIIFNRDALAHLGAPEPRTWVDVGDARLAGEVALVNPAQSGSITTAFEAILHAEGWTRGWAILRRMAANARYFSASSQRPPTDVTQGDAAVGLCIDFYGRYQAQAVRVAGDEHRLGYVDPPGTMIDPDPISVLRGAPDPEMAERFVRFVLSVEGQALWQLDRVRDDAPDADQALGPRAFELRRLPIRRSLYDDPALFARFIDPVDPWTIARPPAHPLPDARSFVAPLFAAMAIDRHHALRDAWLAIVRHPAYPRDGGLVTAADVTDPELRAMLADFDALPVLSDPDGASWSLDDEVSLSTVKHGWLRGAWAEAGLWPHEESGAEAFRRAAGRFFAERYERIAAASAAH